MTFNAALTLVHASILSRFDHCSSLYPGLPRLQIGLLERVHAGGTALAPFPIESSSGFPTLLGDAFWAWRLPPICLGEICDPVPSHGGRCLRTVVHGDLVVPFAPTTSIQLLGLYNAGISLWSARRHGMRSHGDAPPHHDYFLSILSVSQNFSLPPGLGWERLWL